MNIVYKAKSHIRIDLVVALAIISIMFLALNI